MALTHDELRQRLREQQQAFMELLPKFSDQQWKDIQRNDGWTVHEIVGHLSDANYGLSLMVLGEIPAPIPLNEQGQLDPSGINESGRQRNASLSREKLMQRFTKSFEHVLRAIDGTPDLDTASAYGEHFSKGMWLKRILDHMNDHGQELATLRSDG